MWVGNQHAHPLVSCDSLAAPHSCFLTMFLFLSPPPPLRPTPQHPRLWCGRPPFGRPVPPRYPSHPLLPYSVVNPPPRPLWRPEARSVRAGRRSRKLNTHTQPTVVLAPCQWQDAFGDRWSGSPGRGSVVNTRACPTWHPHSHAPPLPRTPAIHPTQTGKRYKSKPLFPNRQQKSPEFFLLGPTQKTRWCVVPVSFTFHLPDTDWLV